MLLAVLHIVNIVLAVGPYAPGNAMLLSLTILSFKDVSISRLLSDYTIFGAGGFAEDTLGDETAEFLLAVYLLCVVK